MEDINPRYICSLRPAARQIHQTQFRQIHQIYYIQGVLSWRASGDRQISLSASDKRAFANFRVKNVVFTGTHFCAVLSMVGERAFVNF